MNRGGFVGPPSKHSGPNLARGPQFDTDVMEEPVSCHLLLNVGSIPVQEVLPGGV